MGSCCKEFEDILVLQMQDIKDSGHCENFPLSYVGTKNKAAGEPVGIAQKGERMVFLINGAGLH